MRYFLQLLLLQLIPFNFVAAMLKSGTKTNKLKLEPEIKIDSKSDNEENETSSVSTSGSSEEESVEVVNELYSTSKTELQKAWNSAIKLDNRNPAIWRKDRMNNVILSCDYTKSSPLAFYSLIKVDENGFGSSVNLEAIQVEYYGVGDEDNHENALKYKAKDQEQDDFLSLIEIALNGNVSDDRGDSYCWVPSSIHQDLFSRDVLARRWHSSLFSQDFKYGMAGHNLAFKHMGIRLKDVRNYAERVLDSLDPINDFMYINNFQNQCFYVIGQINYTEDSEKLAEKIKNNWGLPRVDDFIDPSAVVVTKSKTVVSKPKKAAAKTNSLRPKPNLNEEEWPSLSMPTAISNKKIKATK
jgi:hypothetical protein